MKGEKALRVRHNFMTHIMRPPGFAVIRSTCPPNYPCAGPSCDVLKSVTQTSKQTSKFCVTKLPPCLLNRHNPMPLTPRTILTRNSPHLRHPHPGPPLARGRGWRRPTKEIAQIRLSDGFGRAQPSEAVRGLSQEGPADIAKKRRP